MGILDIILLILLIPGVISGLRRGFTKEVLDLLALVIGIWAACHYHISLADSFRSSVSMDPRLLNIICFAGIFAFTLLIFGLIGILISKVLDIITLGWLNHLLGFVFGVIKSALVIGLIIIVFESLNGVFELVSPETLKGSLIYGYIKDFTLMILPFLKGLVSSSIEVATGIINV